MFMTSLKPQVLSLKVVFRVSCDPTDLPELTTMYFGYSAFHFKWSDSTTLIMKGDEMNVN